MLVLNIRHDISSVIILLSRQGSIVHFFFVESKTRVVETSTEWTESPAGEQDNAFEFLVEKEVVETPEGSVLSKRIGCKIRVVGVDVALQQIDFLVQSDPKPVMNLAVLTCCGDAEKIVNIVGNKLNDDEVVLRIFGY